MNNHTDIAEDIYLQRKGDIPGLRFRRLSRRSRLHQSANSNLRQRKCGWFEHSDKLEDIVYQYTHLIHCDPDHDILFAEVDNNVVGFCRVSWMLDANGQWLGCPVGYVLPHWRHKGIGSSLLVFNEERLRQIAMQLKEAGQIPNDVTCLLDVSVRESEIDRIKLLERNNYEIKRYFFEMVRPNLENIPDLPLPPDVELRAVASEQIRIICELTNEAFSDHWGFTPVPVEVFRTYNE